MKKKLNIIDLFSGIGGFHLAFDEEKYKVNVILASEINKQCIEVYKNNFGIDSNIDIKNITEEELKKRINKHNIKQIDFLVGGFPCQPFSLAGKKKGFDDERGLLVFEVLKIIEILSKLNRKPKIILLENVKYLTKIDNGKIFKKIKKEFKDKNYFIINEPIIISPDDLGIPQHRERVLFPFILNENNDKKREKKIEETLKNISIKKKEKLIKINKFLEKNINKKYYVKDEQVKIINKWGEFIKKVKRNRTYTLPIIWLDEFKNINKKINNEFQEWKKNYILKMRDIYIKNKVFIDSWMKKNDVKNWKNLDRKLEWCAGFDKFEIKNSFIQLRQSGVRCKKPTIFPTLTAYGQIPLFFDKKIEKYRHLTPRECANIQSFPTNFKLDKSDRQAYKQFGNAVNVRVIKYVIEKIIKFIDE